LTFFCKISFFVGAGPHCFQRGS